MSIDTLLDQSVDRRQFLTRAGLVSAGAIGGALLAGCGGSSHSSSSTAQTMSAANDQLIIAVAVVAESLAVTTYTGIINSTIFTSGLAGNAPDQAYLTAARDEEQIHLTALGGQSGTPTFYYPPGMFVDAQTTLNVLYSFEQAFIAAYLIGVQQFSTVSLRLTAAEIMGNESEHRVLARVIANDLGLSQTTGLSKTPDPIQPSNNYAFEKTFGLASISDAQTALMPYINAQAAATAGNTVTAVYAPVTPNSALNDSGS